MKLLPSLQDSNGVSRSSLRPWVWSSLSLCVCVRTPRRTRSGGCTSGTCRPPSPLCWCCSPQPTTRTVNTHPYWTCTCTSWTHLITNHSSLHHSDDPGLLPQQILFHFLCHLQCNWWVIILLSLCSNIMSPDNYVVLPSRNLLSDEPTDSHHLQPVQGISAGESGTASWWDRKFWDREQREETGNR